MPEEIFRIVENLYNEIFNGKYDKAISIFETKTTSSNQLTLFDGGISYNIDYRNRIKQVDKIKLYSLNSLHSSICLFHEYMHGLL